MRILSKIKDYYDGCVGVTGIDSNITYARHTTSIKEDIPTEIIDCANRVFESGMWWKDKVYQNIQFFLIGFCGKLHIGWKVTKYSENGFNTLEPTITFDRKKVQKILGLLDDPSDKYSNYWGANRWNEALKKVDNFENVEIFQKLNVPVFVYDNDRYQSQGKLVLNPILKDYKFAPVIEPFTAFQEISMFMTGPLKAGEVDTVEISDKDRQNAHGYDKWSFRNPDPPKRKQRKKNAT